VSQVRSGPNRQAADGTSRIDLLISAAQMGSDAAFERLYTFYAGVVFRTACSIVRDQGDVEDASQDTFLRAYRGLRGFRGEAQFQSWITRIAINSSLMILRKRRRRVELSIKRLSEAGGNCPLLEFIDARPGPEEVCVCNQAHSSLLGSIKSLPNALRSVVEERVLRERSVEETAEVLGLSPAAIKTRLFRARNRMRTGPGIRRKAAPVQKIQSVS
jgi:RNA polymerase sigma-70 factor, ECF subfamily